MVNVQLVVFPGLQGLVKSSVALDGGVGQDGTSEEQSRPVALKWTADLSHTHTHTHTHLPVCDFEGVGNRTRNWSHPTDLPSRLIWR